MKQTLISLFLFFQAIAAFSQKPEPVYGFARVHRSVEWYEQQQKAWKKEIDKNPSYSLAWWNYYRVTRNLSYAYVHDTLKRRQANEKLDEIYNEVGKYIYDSYEYNLIKWVYNGNDFDSVKYLRRAVELGEDRFEIIDYMINWGEIERDKGKREKWSKKWLESGEYSPGLLYYNYNVIAGTKPNAIIVTGGDNDTYPIWLLQSMGYRKDVTVINTSLLMIDSYRKKLFTELGIDAYEPIWENDSFHSVRHKKFKENLLRILASNKKKYPVYVAVTTHESYSKPFEESLYLTGLAMEYSEKPVDNIAQLKRNFEKEYALDYLDKPFFEDISEERVNSVTVNYIVPLMKLYDHYKEAGDSGKMDWIKIKLLHIVKGREEEADVKKHLSE